jgi:tyrosine-protein kinase Etk/Wzc
MILQPPETAKLPNTLLFSEEEISLSEITSTLYQNKRAIFRVTAVLALLATATALLLPVKYSAECVILTPQQSQSSLSTMAQLAGIGGGANLSGLSLLTGLGLHNSTDLYVGILQSRTIADTIIAKFNLKSVYKKRDLYATRKQLVRNTSIKASRDTLIHIRVEDGDAKRAAELANSYAEELSTQNARVALTEASQRRLFFEGQLVKEKDALANAESALRDVEQFTGLIAPGGQADAMIRSVSQLHAEILSKKAQLEAMKTFVADENPRFQSVKRQINVLEGELANLEQGSHVAGVPEIPVGQIPQASLEYIRKYRDVKYHESLFEIMAKQYEAARMDEARAAPLVQVIDRAVVPERKSWPPRTILVLTATAAGAMSASIWTLLSARRQRRMA